MNPTRVAGFDSSDSESYNINDQKSTNHWKDIVIQYERRNASLEHRQAQLSERLRAMECALPSVLMSAMVSMHYGTEPPKMDLESVLSKSGVAPNHHRIDSRNTGISQSQPNADGVPVELVYKRKEDMEMNQPRNSEFSRTTKSVGNTRFATGDDGCVNHDAISAADFGGQEKSFAQEPASAETGMNLSVMSSRDLMALGRIQELAEQERLLKRYICDLESRENTFCKTLERANRLLNDPLECMQVCLPSCPGTEVKEPLSDDPVMQRLQKLEFYNKRMITSMKGLRQEKNLLIKQTELLKSELRSTQKKLGEVQKEVLGEAKVIPVMAEALFATVEPTCSCTSTTNKDNNAGGKNSSPKTLIELAEQFEDVLQKAKNHGLCKLTGTIKDAATKLKELSKSEEAYKCICDCPCDPVFKQSDTEMLWKAWDAKQVARICDQNINPTKVDEFYIETISEPIMLSPISWDGPCPNCKCGKFDADKLGETGDWFCDSCGGECVCDLVSLDEDYPETNRGKAKGCECGCQNDEIACQCGCGISKINEVGEAGDIPKMLARKLSEDLGGIICKDCGNCKCGDDHSRCPDCVQACTCSCTVTDTVPKLLLKTEMTQSHKERELQDPDICGPRCACNDSDGGSSPENNVVKELRKKFVFPSGKNGNPDLHPCFECEQSEPCDVCFEVELQRLETPKTILGFGVQKLLHLVPEPCKECLKFGIKSNKDGLKISTMCSLCQAPISPTFQDSKTRVVEAKDHRTGDETQSLKTHDPDCPCSCNATLSSNIDQCLCGCGVTIKVSEEVDGEGSCPCGCGQIIELPKGLQESGCDCECAKGGVHCDYCCCIDSILELLNIDEIANTVKQSPETCPCIEDSIREAEMENLAKTLQQDADSIGQKNNLLRQLVAHCACIAPEIIENSVPIEGCPYHDLAPIRPTISGLQAAIELLRVKNRKKDGMIAVLAGNLGGKSDPGKIIENLGAPTVTDTSEDFDHCMLYNYLKGSEPGEDTMSSPLEYLPEGVQEERLDPGKYATQSIDADISWSQSLVPAPRDFKVVKQICNDCLLVAWTPPNDISGLNGYELLVNGYVVNRVRSPTRTETLLVSLDTSRPVMLTLYSLGPRGSSSEPVRITYPACPCVDE